MSSPNEFLPPMIDGVSASQVYLPAQTTAQTIYKYLCQHFQHIKVQEWQQRFQDGLIYGANGQKLTLDSPYQSNTHIFYYRFLAYEPHVPFEHRILFENDDLLVVDKPHFLTISPTGQYVQETLLVRLKKQTDNEFLTPIHRLDRETAGVVLFCKRVESRGIYQQLFAERQVNKIYHAVAPYKKGLKLPQTLHLHLDKGTPFYTMQVVANAKANTQTYIELIEHNQTWAKYRLTPTTGKQHQLRVHLSYLEIPIKNDPFYPTVQHKAEDDFSEPLQLLAKHISFIDPLTKEGMSFKSEFELTL